MSSKHKLKKFLYRNSSFIRKLTDTGVELDLRITMIIVMAGTIGNSLGFIANLALYGMNFPTAFCAVCALFLLLTTIFGLSKPSYRLWARIIIAMLTILEFPLLVFTYGSVMYPYMMIGFLGMLMLTKGKWRIILNTTLGIYDVFVIILSSIHPFIFGPQDTTGLMGSAIVTFLISLGAMTGCVMSWQNVSVVETSDVDTISGVYSRAGFIRNAEEIFDDRKQAGMAVLFFDIKNFKVVNNLYGMTGGNALLRKVAVSLKHSDLKPLLVCRMNSDHFVCLIEKEKLNLGLLNRICQIEYNHNGKSIPLVMHCGIYFADNHEEEIPTMCVKAELACRRVRGSQNDHYFIFDSTIEKHYQQEAELLVDLESAIQDRDFTPYYQPIVDCSTGRIVSAEALVRWKHPEKGVISPGVFIPILEKKELISDLDNIMVDKVNYFIKWQEACGNSVVPISINLSRVDLFDNVLMEKLKNMVKSNTYGVSYRFELTESVFESIPESAEQTLAQLRKMGAEILVDDFGTGYSSLGMITDYEFDYIKMDMSFARKIETSEANRAVIRAIIEMVHKLGARVVTEGVENDVQYEFLKSAGCDLIQGYFFYKPMPENEFIELLKKQNSDEND